MTKHEKKVINGLLRQVIILRDGERCLKCSGTERLQMSHIYPKGKYRKMEFDEQNLKILCYGCHIHWWHKNPIEAHEWLEQTIEKKRLERLKLRARTIDKSTIDYKLLKLYLENIIKKYSV